MTTTTAATDTVTWTPMITNFEVAYTYGAADAPKNAVITIGADTADEAIDRAQHLADYFPGFRVLAARPAPCGLFSG